MMSRNLIIIALVAGALLSYGMGAALHWSSDPGDWPTSTRGTLIFLIWPMVSACVAFVLHVDAEGR